MLTWVAVVVAVVLGGAWRGPGQAALQEGLGCRAVLRLLDAGALRLPRLLPQAQLHREDLQRREGGTDGGREEDSDEEKSMIHVRNTVSF